MVFSTFRQFYFLEQYTFSWFFENKPNELCSHLSEKGPKGRKVLFCAREAPKSRRRRKRKGEKERAKRWKVGDGKKMVALLVFIMATLEIVVLSSQRRGFDYLIWHCAVLIEGYSYVVCRCGNLGSKRHTDQNVIAKELFGKALKLRDSLVFN